MSKPIRLALFALCAALAHGASAATVNAVYVDHGAVGPLPADAGEPAFPYLERQLAERLIVALGVRQVKASAMTHELASKLGTTDLYVSLSYATFAPSTPGAVKYRGFAVYISQQNPAVDVSLSCGWQVARSLRESGERPWVVRPGPERALLDPVGLREYATLATPKSMPGPAIFVDAGAFGDMAERTRLSDPVVIQKMADAIADAIDQCRI